MDHYGKITFIHNKSFLCSMKTVQPKIILSNRISQFEYDYDTFTAFKIFKLLANFPISSGYFKISTDRM